MDILDNIFGSAAKVRMMRLFLHNPLDMFSCEDIMTRTLTAQKEVKEEITNLEKMQLIKKKTIQRKETPESKRVKKVVTWSLNPRFVYLNELRAFLINPNIIKNSDLIKRFNRAGKIKTIIISGVFIHQWDESRVDLLIVGEGLSRSKIDIIIKQLESEVGKELKYSVFETTDFLYRMNMYDKLVRDIFDYPHQVIFDRISVEKMYSDR